jgi:hypothetical protein
MPIFQRTRLWAPRRPRQTTGGTGPTGRRADAGTDLDAVAYTALKAEQSSRIGLRDNYSLTYVATIATIFFGYFTTKNVAILLAVPVTAYVGMHAYATNDARISDIRKFLKDSLPPSLAREWEQIHQQPGMAISLRSTLRIITGTLLFVGPTLVSLAVIFTEEASLPIRVAAISMTFISLTLMVTAHLVLSIPKRTAKTSHFAK